MCGILGIVSRDARPVTATDEEVQRLRDWMRARGPDDAGLVRPHPRVVLAHRRLAIRDPTQGSQPWVSADGRWTLTYNGELYNTTELVAGTSARFPQPPTTRCDTEILMRVLQVEEANAPAQLRGMFAWGAYDAREERLILARDRFGIKPLYFMSCGNEFVFASSPRPLLLYARSRPAVNSRALAHYLQTLRLTLGMETLWEGIYSLPPAHRLILDQQGLSLERYWDYPQGTAWSSPEQACEALQGELAEAVRIRLVSDVPVGMMLSGGVDSCLLGSYVREELGPRFIAECGSGQQPSELAHHPQAEDETGLAAKTARFLGCQFRGVEVSEEEYRLLWRELIAESGQPLATPSDVIIYRLAQSLKQQVGVVLGGEGADELFGGYASIHGLALTQTPDSPTGRAALVERYLAASGLIPAAGLRLLLRNSPDESIAAIQAHYLELLGNGTGTLFSGMLRLLHTANLESLLARLDRATMAASLEARVPFTDHRLVERFWNLPTEYCLPGGLADSDDLPPGKWLLRQHALTRLPREIAARPKASFPTPVLAWLADRWGAWSRDILLNSPLLQELFEAQPLQELAEHPAQAGLWQWPLLNLGLWDETIRDA